jgi:predicted MFS family arabinose efflux permease
MASHPTDGRERALIAILFATWGFVFLDRMAVLYLAPFLMRDLRLDAAQVGLLAGAIAISWALSALAFGAVSDRLGRKTVLVPMVVAFSVLSAACGLAQNFEQLLVLRILLGIAEGPCWSVMMALVEENSSPEHRGRNVGIVVGAAAIVGLAAAPVLTTQIAAHWGWRPAFYVAGVPGLALAVLIALFVREPARQRTRSLSARGAWTMMSTVVKSGNVWACAAGAVGVMAWLFLINAFGPLYITEVAHQSATTAGLLMGAAGLGSFCIGLAGPALSDRFGRRPVLAIHALISIVLPLALLAQPLYRTEWLLAGVLFLTQGGQAISAICIVLIPTASVPKNLAATAIGFTTLFGEVFGGCLAPLVAGSLAERYGIGTPLWMAAGGALLVFVAALVIHPAPEDRRELSAQLAD